MISRRGVLGGALPCLSREEWVSAKPVSRDEWIVTAKDARIRLGPFMSIGDETCRLCSRLCES